MTNDELKQLNELQKTIESAESNLKRIKGILDPKMFSGKKRHIRVYVGNSQYDVYLPEQELKNFLMLRQIHEENNIKELKATFENH